MKKYAFLVMVVVLLLPLCVQAQEEEHPLLAMLRFIPDTPPAREFAVFYADFRAAELVMTEDDMLPRNVAEYVAEANKDDSQLMRWASAMPDLLLEELPIVLARGTNRQTLEPEETFHVEQMDAVLGFNLFDIDRTLSCGLPPNRWAVLNGDFDAEAIAAAYTERGYTSQDMNGLTVWCEGEGCEGMAPYDRDRIDMANIFGGRLGRRETLAVAPGYLVDSSNFDNVETSAATYAGLQASLADAPEYQTAVEAITTTGTLVQALLVNPAETLVFPYAGSGMSEAAQPLPAYSLLIVADVLDETDRVTLVGLVYDNQDDAETATRVIPARVAKYQSYEWKVSLTELLEDRADNIEMLPVFTSSTTGKSVALLALHKAPPQPDTEVEPGTIDLYYTGGSLPLLARMVLSRDTGWLASKFGE